MTYEGHNYLMIVELTLDFSKALYFKILSPFCSLMDSKVHPGKILPVSS